MEAVAVTETSEEFHFRQEPKIERKPEKKETLKQTKLGKMRERKKMMESWEAECEPALLEPNETVYASEPAIGKPCPDQVVHILEGNLWKTCRSCRGHLGKVAHQLMGLGLYD
jgi:hypothetical protein